MCRRFSRTLHIFTNTRHRDICARWWHAKSQWSSSTIFANRPHFIAVKHKGVWPLGPESKALSLVKISWEISCKISDSARAEIFVFMNAHKSYTSHVAICAFVAAQCDAVSLCNASQYVAAQCVSVQPHFGWMPDEGRQHVNLRIPPQRRFDGPATLLLYGNDYSKQLTEIVMEYAGHTWRLPKVS